MLANHHGEWQNSPTANTIFVTRRGRAIYRIGVQHVAENACPFVMIFGQSLMHVIGDQLGAIL